MHQIYIYIYSYRAGVRIKEQGDIYVFLLTTLLDKLQQQYKIGDKQSYIPRVVYPNGKGEKRDTTTHARRSP